MEGEIRVAGIGLSYRNNRLVEDERCAMRSNTDTATPLEDPHAALARALIRDALRERGYTPLSVAALPPVNKGGCSLLPRRTRR